MARTHTLGILGGRWAGLFVWAWWVLWAQLQSGLAIWRSYRMGRWDFFFQKRSVPTQGCDGLTWRGTVKSIAVGFKRRNHFSIIGTFSFSFSKCPAPLPQLWISSKLQGRGKDHTEITVVSRSWEPATSRQLSACGNGGYNYRFMWLHFLLSV